MRRLLTIVVLAAAGGFQTDNALAEENAPPIQEAAPVESSPAPATPADPQLKDVLAEVARLRDEVLRLQQTLDMYMNGTVADLRTENERLRKEIRELYLEKGRSLPPVPMPDKALLEGLYGENKRPAPADASQAGTDENGSGKETPDAEQTQKPSPPAAFTHEVVAEWGRTPEEAAAKEPKVASLKGMIVLVPEGSREEDLITLGGEMRKQFDAYDNINIEVFDQREAAEAYTGRNVVNSAHRVLSVSKHAASGRDKIVLIQGDKTAEVPLDDQP